MEQVFLIIILIISIVIHEIAHGAVANHLGDPTAKYAGRLSLNPIPHLDPIGSVLIPFILIITGSPFLIGWAKPVLINPHNLRNPKKDMAKIAIAGPAVNFIVAIFFSILIQTTSLSGETLTIFSIIIFLNILLGVFNLMPIPPLDGSKILFSFLPFSLEYIQDWMERYSLFLFFGFLFLLFQGIIPLFEIIIIIFYNIAGAEALRALFIFFIAM
jgi:Zn-dependent protease